MEMKRPIGILAPIVLALALIPGRAHPQDLRPLTVSENGRFLTDDRGQPFFILADTAWPLFTGLSREDVQFYLDDRKAKGFNTILCSLLHFRPYGQTEWTPKHRIYGYWAFEGDHYDLARPSKQYFEHVDWVMRQAEMRRLRLAIVPCWFRHSRSAWKQQLTPETAAAFGKYLGLRSCRYDNIIWLFGGDHPPTEKTRELRLLAEGIRCYAPHHLISYHASPASSSGDFAHDERWLAFNSIQTRGPENTDEYALIEKDYRRIPAKPTWLAEPCYERPGTRFAVRQAAWRSALNGGAGFGYGVQNLFNLDSPEKWKDRLDMPGAADVVNMLKLLESQPWHKLLPDYAAHKRLLAAVQTQTQAHFPSACSTDGDFGLIYLPFRAALGVNMGRFNAPVIGTWFDPKTALSTPAEGSPFINAGIHIVRPPKTNQTQTDLVLLLKTEPKTKTTKIPNKN